MNLIEVTIKVTGQRTTVNVDNVESFDEHEGYTMIIFPNSNITVNESYEEIKSLLIQM